MCKTKVMKCRNRSDRIEKSDKWPCRICKKCVDSNSIQCSGILGELQEISNFCCTFCVTRELINVVSRELINVINEDLELGLGDRVDLVERFCYLGDVIGAGCGLEYALSARVRGAWAKFL